MKGIEPCYLTAVYELAILVSGTGLKTGFSMPLERHGYCTLGTHISFHNLDFYRTKKPKTNRYEVVEKHDTRNKMGRILWFARWQKYVFMPNNNTIYDEICMREISQFIEEETVTHKAATKNKKPSLSAAR